MREKTREIDQSNMQQKGQTCLSTSCVRSVHFRNKNCICQPGDEMPSSKLFRIPLLETTYLPVLFIHKSAISAYCLFPYSYFGGRKQSYTEQSFSPKQHFPFLFHEQQEIQVSAVGFFQDTGKFLNKDFNTIMLSFLEFFLSFVTNNLYGDIQCLFFMDVRHDGIRVFDVFQNQIPLANCSVILTKG